MTTITTPDDLLLLLREDAAFRATMRRELLTVELLEMPQSVAALVEHANATNARLDRMDETIAAIIEQTNAINARLDRMDQTIAAINARLDRMDETIAAINARLDRMDETIAAIIEQTNAINARLDRMDARLDRMDETIAAIVEQTNAMNRRLAIVERDINGLGESFRREVRAQSSFRGNYAQRATVMSNQEIASRFAHLHGLHRITTRRVNRATSEAWLANNIPLVESLGLRERAWNTFLVPDDIAGVVPLGASNDTEPSFYIVVESSYTVDEEDILKATDHAQIVRAVTGTDAYAVVAGSEVDDKMTEEARRNLYVEVERFAEANNPNAVYFYLLDSADMRPPEPR